MAKRVSFEPMILRLSFEAFSAPDDPTFTGFLPIQQRAEAKGCFWATAWTIKYGRSLTTGSFWTGSGWKASQAFFVGRLGSRSRTPRSTGWPVAPGM